MYKNASEFINELINGGNIPSENYLVEVLKECEGDKNYGHRKQEIIDILDNQWLQEGQYEGFAHHDLENVLYQLDTSTCIECHALKFNEDIYTDFENKPLCYNCLQKALNEAKYLLRIKL